MENSTLFLDVYIRSLPLKEEQDSYKEQNPPALYPKLTTADGSADKFLNGLRKADEVENKPYFLVAPKEKSHRHECDDVTATLPGVDGFDYTLLDDGRLKVNSCPVVSCY